MRSADGARKVLYGMMCYPDGGTVDDLLVYKEFRPDHYLLVVNAANIDKDFAWIQEQEGRFDVKVDNRVRCWGQIAVQGPEAEKTLVDVLGFQGSSGPDLLHLLRRGGRGPPHREPYRLYRRGRLRALYPPPENIVEIWEPF